jgi:hypothetical protein
MLQNAVSKTLHAHIICHVLHLSLTFMLDLLKLQGFKGIV